MLLVPSWLFFPLFSSSFSLLILVLHCLLPVLRVSVLLCSVELGLILASWESWSLMKQSLTAASILALTFPHFLFIEISNRKCVLLSHLSPWEACFGYRAACPLSFPPAPWACMVHCLGPKSTTGPCSLGCPSAQSCPCPLPVGMGCVRSIQGVQGRETPQTPNSSSLFLHALDLFSFNF